MMRVLVVLAIATVVAPAFAAVGDKDYFQVTGDGSFDLYRSSSGPEIGNNGAGGLARLNKANQDMGWMSFYNAVGDGGGSIANFVATKAGGDWSKVQAKLYFRTDGTGDATAKMAVISIRSGNTGGLVEDGNSGGRGYSDVGSGFQGSSQSVAFRACAPTNPVGTPTGFANQGDGLYPFDDPTNPNPGTPWIAPAGRTAGTGRNGFLFGAGQAIQYDVDGDGTNADSGLYDGYNQDGAQGANFWALEDLLGIRQNNGSAGGGAAQVYAAGQILVGGQTTPTLFNPTDPAFNASDPRKGTLDPNWKAIALDQAFIQDIGTNPEAKGLAFTSRIAGVGVDTFLNTAYYTKDQSGGAWAPYIQLTVVPEPATLCLLALGGLALMRRRQG